MAIFLAIIGGVVTFLIIRYIKSVSPFYRFLSRAEYARDLYEILYDSITKKGEEKEDLLATSIVNQFELTTEVTEFIFKRGVYSITLDKNKNRKDIMQELKNIINDALSYSEPIEDFIVVDAGLKDIQKELLEMSSNIGMWIWQNT